MRIKIRYVATLTNARDVTLQGSADLAYFEHTLARQGLTPVEKDGRAQIAIVAAHARFKGISFSEMVVTVLARHKQADTLHEGAFLFQAFNSNRFFALVERTRFSTPYLHAQCDVSESLPASITVIRDGETWFQAAMNPCQREPAKSEEFLWQFPVFLPRRRRDRTSPGRVFLGKISGHTRTYPFLPSDSLTISPIASELRPLTDAQFTPESWSVRTRALHARSNTLRRSPASMNSIAEKTKSH